MKRYLVIMMGLLMVCSSHAADNGYGKVNMYGVVVDAPLFYCAGCGEYRSALW